MCLEVGSVAKAILQGCQSWLLAQLCWEIPASDTKPPLSGTCSPTTRPAQGHRVNRQNGPCGLRLNSSALSCGRDSHSLLYLFIFFIISHHQEDELFQAQLETPVKIKVIVDPSSPNWSTTGKLKTHTPQAKTGCSHSGNDLPRSVAASLCSQPLPGGM